MKYEPDKVSHSSKYNVNVYYWSSKDVATVISFTDTLWEKISDRVRGFDPRDTVGCFLEDEFRNEHLFFPERTVVVSSIPRGASKSDRLNFGATLVHEFEHVRGGEEIDAFLSEREYLQRNGLSGPSDWEILVTISKRYRISEAIKAAEILYPSLDPITRAVLIIKAKISPETYDIDEDLLAKQGDGSL